MLQQKVFWGWLLIICIIAPRLEAVGTQTDYDRALNLDKLFGDKVYKQKVEPHWFDDNNQFWYRNDLPDGRKEFIRVHAQNGYRRAAFDQKRLAEALSNAADRKIDEKRLPFEQIVLSDNGGQVRFSCFDRSWVCDLQTYAIQPSDEQVENTDALPVQNELRPSRNSQEETWISFVNMTDETVKIYWLDTGNGRRLYTELGPGQTRRQHTFAGHAWLVTTEDEKPLAVFTAELEGKQALITQELLDRPAVRQRRRGSRGLRGFSPDRKFQAAIKDYNVYLINTETDTEIPLTTDGTEQEYYSGRMYWSPDSSYLVAIRTQKGFDRQVHIVESSPDDQLQPKLHSFSYKKPGDDIDLDKPRLFDIENRKQIPIDDALFDNPWSVNEVRWCPGSKRFTFEYNQRGHQVLRVLAVNAADGQVETIIEETSKTFIDYAGKSFSHYLDETGEIIWMSERDGWCHLYLYDGQTGQAKNQITKGQWVVRRVERVDPEKQQIWFWASGIVPEQDPYYLHLCRVNFDGSELRKLTKGDGTHQVDFSPDRRFFIDRWSRVDLPPVSELRSTQTGDLICPLEEADWSELLATGWQPPERFCAKGRDGQTDIYGIIIRPTIFDPNRPWPVIEKIYAGPQGSFVPKSFGLQTSERQLAELGFILVQIDGMGTSNRSKAFHDVCWKNLGDSGFPDRIAWMKAAAQKYPYLDLSRVGIYGGSAGGQSALGALLTHGEFYKAAAADCGCHDNRMDKIWWNELWMGWPVGPHYKEQSNVTNVHKLTGKLLLTVGELDRNVDPASTMQVVNALIKANKDFELVIFPGRGHGAGGSDYGQRKRMDFFVKSLLGINPPGWQSN